MGRKNKFLIAILVVLAASVLLTSVLTVYLVITRQQKDIDLVEPGEDLALLLTPTEPVAELRIAYVTDRSDDDDLTAIYVIEVGVGEQGYLDSRYIDGSEDGIYVLPSWSPDGQKIAYLVQVPREDGASEDDYRSEVWVAAVDGSEQIRVSDAISDVLGSDWTVATWSPDGTRVAFTAEVAGNTDTTIYVVRADGSRIEHRIPLEWYVDRVFWSPTSDELLFFPQTRASKLGAFLLQLEGEQIVEVYEHVQVADSWGATADWSVNGIEFVIAHHLSQRILIVGTDGEASRAVQLNEGFPVEVAWSPDGAYIAITASTAPQQNAEILYVLELEAGRLTTAFNDGDRSIFLPDWSPDGGRVLFSTIRDRQEGVPNPVEWPASTLWTYDVASSQLQQLTPGEVHDGMGAWSP
jgi:Tol biopolymer transport system component